MELVEHVLTDVVFLQPRERLTVENEADLKAVVSQHLHAGRVRIRPLHQLVERDVLR